MGIYLKIGFGSLEFVKLAQVPFDHSVQDGSVGKVSLALKKCVLYKGQREDKNSRLAKLNGSIRKVSLALKKSVLYKGQREEKYSRTAKLQQWLRPKSQTEQREGKDSCTEKLAWR